MKRYLQIALAILGMPLVGWGLVLAALRALVRGPIAGARRVGLVYSQVSWDEVWQRPQQYAWLASREHAMIYCCPVQPHNLLYLGRRWSAVRKFSGQHRLTILSPMILSGHFKHQWINSLNCWIVALHLRLALGDKTLVHCLSNTPFAVPVLSHLFYKGGKRSPGLVRLIFDVIDDFTVFDWSPAFSRVLDQQLMAMADKVITGTFELARLRPGAEFIACGVDYELFSQPTPLPTELEALPRPILGYYGTISERLDLELLADLAGRFSGGSLVLIGPVHLPEHLLPRSPNIHYLGLRRHGDLPGFAQHFDVGLIPFRLTEATLKLNPVKTLEYLAAGLPVVATPLPDIERFTGEAVYLADRDNFADTVARAIDQPDPDRTAVGRNLARESAWSTMEEKITGCLFEVGKPPQAGHDLETES